MRKLIFCMMVLCSFILLPASGWAASGTTDPVEPPRTVTPESFYLAMMMAAEKNDVDAMLNLGVLYEQGIGVPKNFTQALSWYEKSGNAGSADGNYRAGLCYETGLGTTANLSTAMKYFEKAAAKGFSPAQYKLGSFYLTGRGVSQNNAKGIEFITKAAQAGNGAAANEMGFINLNGMYDQKKDAGKARDWFVKSAELGHLEGMKNLAVMFKDGIGKKPDPAGALRWYLIAQKGGLRTNDLDDVIAGLKKDLKPGQVKDAEESADKWVEAFTKKKTAEAEKK
ncbi:sel1 repeat family protein [Desulfosarcina sp. OttesenSCG-928-A07]|nr:sel1 repeat family protein [Desulfosarcina sp. OttesenSCG-928-G17]MDL2330179.1 sel1 repeat family protein [Desulfosarcina sp. OttesenSCG-928-A07]